LLLKVLRPDRLQTALTHFACEAIGVSTISPPPLNLARIISAECSPRTPVLFICEGGADPTQELEECAAKSGAHSGELMQVALGSGQTDLAMQMLYKAAKEGSFLLLKNLHLVTPWLSELEKTLKLLEFHPNFRLMLTTEVSASFPTILLQESLLISYESPPGIKQNLLRTYEGWDAAFLAKGSATRAQLLFILAWFHAIVQERRTYLPQGWTKFYEFSFADLRASTDVVDALVAKMPGGGLKAEWDPAAFPWLTIWGLAKFALYGGRVDNDHDVRVLVTYLRKFFARDIVTSPNGQLAGRKLTPGLEMPATNQHADFMRLINKLPDTDAPALFSLPENVEGAVQETQSAAVITQLRKLAVEGSSLVKFDRDVWRTQLTPLLQLWEKGQCFAQHGQHVRAGNA
jgi:dynein heavy chain 2